MSEVQRRKPAKAAEAAEPAEPAAASRASSPYVKAALFFSVVPITFLLPYTIEYVVEYTRDVVDYLQYVWYAYGVVVAYFYWTKTKHSNDSFFSQLLTWLLFALGFHAVTGIFNFLPPADRMVVLKLWVTITFVPYAIYVYYDEFDYKGRERKDELKEKKRKEREIRRDEKIKQARRERKKEMRALGSLS